MKTFFPRLLAISLVLGAPLAAAGPDDFGPGPLIKGYGNIAEVEGAVPIPPGLDLKMAYDVREGGAHNEVNGTFNSVANLMNVLVANDVAKERIQLALVIHGPAYKDILSDKAYGGSNPNRPLLEQLLANGVRIYYCGQAAVARDVSKADVIPGIEFSLSASAAHVTLQMEGYGVRPY